MTAPAGRAPEGPGALPPTWTSSTKDMVTTTPGTGRVWATLGYGIVNEVYWPSTGTPQVRDLGFLVSHPGGWSEVKRLLAYAVAVPRPDVPLPTVTHEGPGFRLTLEIVADPVRDALLIRHALEGEGCRLHVLLAPRLGLAGHDNRARAGAALTASGAGAHLALVADMGFEATSAGIAGVSDGWQDFSRNGGMTWAWAEAGPGNVALTGRLPEGPGTLALGFAGTPEGARTLALSSLAEGFAAARDEALRLWSDWADHLDLPLGDGLPDDLADQARLSAAVLKCHEDRTFPGAVVASLSVPWGQSRDDPGGYHLVWPRDAVNGGLALLAAGHPEGARRMLAHLVAQQEEDGHWAQNLYPDGRPYWRGVQLDETAYPVLLAARMRECGALDPASDEGRMARAMTRRALGYIARTGPVTDQDRWEENAGLSVSTLAVTLAALVAGASALEPDEREAALLLADDWNARAEGWLVAEGTEVGRRHGVAAHYCRLAPDPARPLAEQVIDIRNRGGLSRPAGEVVAMDFLALARFGIRPADDPLIEATLRVCEAELGRDLPGGRAYLRYSDDGYGEHEDGAPFDGQGVGRAWPLLSGERGHLALMRGEDPTPWLRAMRGLAGPGGMMPEQVWDGPILPGRALRPGRPTGGAMPLAWAHAEFLRLCAACRTGRPVELSDAVLARWPGGRVPAPARRHWRAGTPVARMEGATTLVVEGPGPFLLHLGWDDWATPIDVPSAPLPFGRHGVALAWRAGARRLVFTRRLGDAWEGRDHAVEA